MATKYTVLVTHQENLQYWNGKLPTWRDATCRVTRSVTPVVDPNGYYDDMALLKTPSGVVLEVNSSGEILGERK
jgi:hypothetical protein